MKTPVPLLFLALAFVAASPGATHAAAPEGGARDPRCHALDEEKAKTYALLSGCSACTEKLHALDFCHGDARGVWSSRFDDVVMTAEPPDPEAAANLPALRVTWSLVRRDDGRPAAPSVVPLERGQDGENWSFLDRYWFNPPAVNVRFFDYDGDSTDEIILSSYEHHFEGVPRTLIELWTSRAGAIEAYPTGVRGEITRVEDVDNDGRPDLVTLEVSLTVPSGAAAHEVGPDVVYHSLPGGKFDGRDAVARAAFERSCPPELRSFDGDKGRDPDSFAMLLICSRAAGMTAEQVAAGARRLLGDGADSWFDVKGAPDEEPSFHIAPR